MLTEQYNPWYKSTNKPQAPEDICTNIRNMLSSEERNNKASNVNLVYIYSILLYIITYIIIKIQRNLKYTQLKKKDDFTVFAKHMEPWRLITCSL